MKRFASGRSTLEELFEAAFDEVESAERGWRWEIAGYTEDPRELAERMGDRLGEWMVAEVANALSAARDIGEDSIAAYTAHDVVRKFREWLRQERQLIDSVAEQEYETWAEFAQYEGDNRSGGLVEQREKRRRRRSAGRRTRRERKTGRGGGVPRATRTRLTPAEREKLPPSAFVFPERRAWPIHDLYHAKLALTWAKWPQHRKVARTVRKTVYQKWPELKGEAEQSIRERLGRLYEMLKGLGL